MSNVNIITFCRKGGEVVDCWHLAAMGLSILILNWSELRIAALQPVGPNPIFFYTGMVEMLASMMHLFASRRLMSETLDLLQKRKRPPNTWPRLSEWIEMIASIQVSAASRYGQYKEAALYALKKLYFELGPAIDYASSNFFEQIFAYKGCVVITTTGLSVESESVLASLFINYAYRSREGVDPDTLEPLIFILDDALPLVRGNHPSETEGGINPFSTWMFMGRSRKIGFVISAQNFSLISPALKGNVDTVLCFSSYGSDSRELEQYLNLTPEQAAVLPTIRPGEVIAIARSVHPLPVYGLVPELP